MTKKENFLKGFIKENPIFVFLLGMCPALAVTYTFETSVGMGILVIFVLTSSNIVVSLIKGFIPNEIRTPSYIVVIASFVTIVQMLTEAFTPALFEALGIFIPLIVVNCLILGRAESFASKNSVADSAIDGLGMGLGFTFALIVIGVFRELLATGGIQWGVYIPFFTEQPIHLFTFDWIIHIFNSDVTIKDYGLFIFSMPPGAFITLGFILAFIQGRRVKQDKLAKERRKKMLIERAKNKKLAKQAKAGETS